MTATQAAEVGSVGGSAVGVGDDVVGVGPTDALSAGREPAGPVAGVDEGLLSGARVVAVDLGRPVQHRAPAGAVEVVGATAAGQTAQLVEGRGGPEGAVIVGEREGDRAALGGAEAEGVEFGEQRAEPADGDRQAVDLRGLA